MKRSTPLRRTGIPGRKTPLVSRSQLRRRMILRSEEQGPQAEPGQRREQPLRRRARLAPVNVERAARRFVEQFGGEARVSWLHSLGCVTPGCNGTRIHAHHVVSRARGGGPDDLIPVCHDCHLAIHAMGTRAFEARHGISLADLAAAHALRWRQYAQPAANVGDVVGAE